MLDLLLIGHEVLLPLARGISIGMVCYCVLNLSVTVGHIKERIIQGFSYQKAHYSRFFGNYGNRS